MDRKRLCVRIYDDDGEYFDAHYDSKNLLGSGTFGIVLCCVHKRDGSLSAVKMVQDLTESEAEVQREIEALRLIKQEGGHENIVRYNGAYRHNGFHYIVTEFVDGETLYSMLQQRQRPFDEATSLQMVVQLGSALSFLKQTEIIHRDLKPDNIMVLRDGDSDNVNLKIIDFGSAGTSGEQNREMSLSGTRCYLSPEVLLNGEVSHAMDVWSLGCILYILLSGRHPFDLTGVSTEEQIVARISSEAVSFDLPVWQHVSSDVKKLIVRLLEKNPRERLTEIESAVDAWRYQGRVRDAVQHSEQLSKEFPVHLIKPLRSGSRAKYSAEQDEHGSRAHFLHLLQQLDSEEYGEPDRGARLLPPVEEHDHLKAIQKVHRDLARRLQKTLNSHSASNGALIGKADRRFRPEDYVKRYNRAIRMAGPYDGKALPPTKHSDEIERLEAQLEKHRISRSKEELDELFYSRLATRETNVIVEEVLSELLLETSVEAYEDAERALRGRELPPEQLRIVQDALTSGPDSRVLIEKYNVNITRRHLQCLLPMQWLNDEVINFWFQMLNDRDVELVNSGVLAKRSHFFNSFFYTKVSENGYNFVNVRRWTRKIDIFAMDKIFVPVNLSNTHWCLAVIHMTEKRIQYYDSMDGSGTKCLNVLLKYLHDESEHKKKQKFDEEGWELVESTPETPQQQNGSDCGVFTCMFADYLSQNMPLTFSQKDMEFHRHRMVLHIVEGSLPLNEDL
ncbi:TPA: hypothetical protein N0F65_006391 [Lagenidium giganteum]|uniref:Uncharacterized protein n=1 Tax=Lagenidium giganteum TaxID=4803 RepID=A0AAV2YQY0_9STRA|nr:TPA: hypothetical protein N0F65_006391 [Lagenidium giganteum]